VCGNEATTDDRTDGGDGGVIGGGGDGIPPPQPDSGNQVIDVTSETQHNPDGVEHTDQGYFIETDPEGPDSCKVGSLWQGLSGFDYPSCFKASACANVTRSGQKTCVSSGKACS
jgi:hypothetical protein